MKGEDDPDIIRDCYAVDEFSDACECEPEPLTNVRLSRDQRRELNRLKAFRKIACEKVALLKCTLDIQRYQARVWESERVNTCGDYFASVGKNSLKKT
jgi:hypothetical protein